MGHRFIESVERRLGANTRDSVLERSVRADEAAERAYVLKVRERWAWRVGGLVALAELTYLVLRSL